MHDCGCWYIGLSRRTMKVTFWCSHLGEAINLRVTLQPSITTSHHPTINTTIWSSCYLILAKLTLPSGSYHFYRKRALGLWGVGQIFLRWSKVGGKIL